MTDRDAFIAAIAAAPADDTPRLAFADWLEEHGDAARAGFVRDQVRLATLRPGTDEYRQLFRRTADTLRANLPAWIQSACDAFGQPAEWQPSKRPGPGLGIGLDSITIDAFQKGDRRGLRSCEFVRGFVGSAYIYFPDLDGPQPLETFFREHPVTRLTFPFPPLKQDWLKVATPSLKQIRALTLCGFTSDEAADAMLADAAWAGVTRLRLLLIRTNVVQRLCASPMAKRLTGLAVPCLPSHFGELNHFPVDDRLQELALQRPHGVEGWPPPQTLDGWDRLSTMTFRPTLKRLDLAACNLRDRGLATFARGDVWIRLRAMALDRNRFGDPGWRDFVRGRRTPELRTLTASRNFLTGDGAVRLGQSPLVETLEYIDLRGNRIDGKGAVALARYLRDGPLKKLLLAGNPLSAKDADAVRTLLGERVVV